jgi:hypothetical protein
MRRIINMDVGVRDHRPATFYRLPQGFQGGPREFRQLVQKQMLLWAREISSGCTRVPRPRQFSTVEKTSYAVDHTDLQRLFRRSFWHETWKPLRQHGFSCTCRAHYQQVVGAGRGDFEH